MATTGALVAGGLGVALVPRSVAALGLAGVVFRPLAAKPPVPSLDLALAWRRAEVRRRPSVKAFLEIVRRDCGMADVH